MLNIWFEIPNIYPLIVNLQLSEQYIQHVILNMKLAFLK